jgi:hypothetical protein
VPSSTWISTFFGTTATGVGIVSSSIPLVYFAWTLPGSMPSGSEKVRSNEP